MLEFLCVLGVGCVFVSVRALEAECFGVAPFRRDSFRVCGVEDIISFCAPLELFEESIDFYGRAGFGRRPVVVDRDGTRSQFYRCASGEKQLGAQCQVRGGTVLD